MAAERDPAKCCGAKKSDGSICRAWKGFGTTHPGYGACKGHGGASPNHQVAAEKQMAVERMRTYGAPIDIDPDVALTEEVRRTAGHVRWLQDLIAELMHDGDGYEMEQDDNGVITYRPKTGLKQLDRKGSFEKSSVWLEMYQTERQMLARVCKMALDAGVAERQVKLAEAQGEMIGKLIDDAINDEAAALTQEQRTAMRAAFGRALRAMPMGV